MFVKGERERITLRMNRNLRELHEIFLSLVTYCVHSKFDVLIFDNWKLCVFGKAEERNRFINIYRDESSIYLRAEGLMMDYMCRNLWENFLFLLLLDFY